LSASARCRAEADRRIDSISLAVNPVPAMERKSRFTASYY
jgi:hypothetical protein